MWKYVLPNSRSHRDDFLAVAEGCFWQAKVRRLPSFPAVTTINKDSLIGSGAHSAHHLKPHLGNVTRAIPKGPNSKQLCQWRLNGNCDLLQIKYNRSTRSALPVKIVFAGVLARLLLSLNLESNLGCNTRVKQMRYEMAEWAVIVESLVPARCDSAARYRQ